jgi:hypothetical protein
VAVEPQPEARQVARPFVIQTLLARAEHAHVAVQIEHGEGVVVLQNSGAFPDARGRRQDVELILDLDDVVHYATSRADTLIAWS